MQNAEIQTTKNYEMFNRLIGNRPVQEAHVQQIMDLIRKNGQTFTTIVVNENMEVIDGQHRLEAFRRLNLPVHYIVLPVASFEDCILMNASQVGWSITDYIYGHAERGNENYVALKEMFEEFGYLGISVLTAIISRRVNGVAHTKKASQSLRTGEFVFPFDDKDKLIEEFKYLSKFTLFRKKAHGRNDIFYQAVAACYECSEINNDRLLERMQTNPDRFGAYNTFKDCLQSLQGIYNLYSKKKVYVQHEVERMLDEAKKGGVED